MILKVIPSCGGTSCVSSDDEKKEYYFLLKFGEMYANQMGHKTGWLKQW